MEMPVASLSSLLFPAELSAIDTSDRLRPADEARVEALAASLSEIGQQQPIVVRPNPGGNGLRLVAGLHRVKAAQLLGWTEVVAVWTDVDEAEARLIEIDENLIRNELSEIDRAVSLAERKRIYESLHPETANGKAKKPKKGNDLGKVANLATFARFSKDAARQTGLGERTIQRAVALAAALSPEVIALIRGTKIADNQAQLLKLADEPAECQLAVAKAMAEGKAANFVKAKIAAGYAPPPRPAEKPLIQLEVLLGKLNLEQLRAHKALVDLTLKLREEGTAAVAARKAAKKGGA